jgi:hypothetical protein
LSRRRLDPRVALEDLLQLVRRDPDAVISDREHDRLILEPGADIDDAAVRRVLDGVRQEVDADLRQPLRVGGEHRQPLGEMKLYGMGSGV